MKVEVQEINSCQKKLAVEIPLEVVKKELDSLYRDLQGKVKVKGFRPGKVPKGILERLYKNEVESEVINKIIPDTCTKIIQENGIRAIGHPRLDEVELEKEKPLRFTAIVDVIPNISLKDYGGWELTKKIVRVTEDQLDEELGRLREIHAQWDAVDRPAQKGDYIALNYQGSLEGKKLPELRAEHLEAIIGSNYLPPSFEEQLIGMNIGEKRDIKVSFPLDHSNEKLAGKEVLFEVQLEEIKVKRLSELNDEFAREVREDVETLEELKQKTLKLLEEYAANRAETLLKKEIVDRLVAENPFPVPEPLIEAEVQRMLYNMEAGLELQGKRLEAPEFYRERFREAALNNVQAELILEKIQTQETIEVSEEEMDNEVELVASRFKKSEELIKTEMGEKLRSQLGRRKALDLLVKKCKIQEEIVAPEDLPANAIEGNSLAKLRL